MSRISQITADIENYKEAIRNAEGALEEAERELQEELMKYYVDDPEDLPPDT